MKELTIFLICVICIFALSNLFSKYRDVTLVTSTINNKSYYVRKLPDSQEAADLLAKICGKLEKLCDSIRSKKLQKTEQLLERFDCQHISETVPGSQYTSYSVNKGEQLALCLREKDTNRFIDINTIIFVAIHELSHIMTKEVGHTPQFWKNMKFLLEQAGQISIYTPIDYSKHPVNYCGMVIDSSPYDFTN